MSDKPLKSLQYTFTQYEAMTFNVTL